MKKNIKDYPSPKITCFDEKKTVEKELESVDEFLETCMMIENYFKPQEEDQKESND